MNRLDDIEVIYGRPLYLMAKPAGAACNLRRSYCYYLEKRDMYQDPSQLMSDDTLELFIKEYIEAQTTPEVMFIWHLGRHTYAMMALNGGVDIKTTSALLGHASTLVTEKVYATLLPNTIAEVVGDKLNVKLD